ncbi:sigma-54-dependent transcriptional regulator [Sinimarinibacterium flocculans]|uniref:sigma-54-dependent transcriptional regulator n=1 Tax=Sinimarinibacterium flocculans TaxID=985250 RepID=UPI00351421B8
MSRDMLIYVVEDSPTLGRLYCEYLRAAGHEVLLFTDGSSALGAVRERAPQLLVLDLGLPDMSGLEVLETLRRDGARCGTVVITADGSVSSAVEAMRLGALDFLEKPFNGERLRTTVGLALERCQLRRVAAVLGSNGTRQGLGGFIGSSLPMQVAYRVIESAASSKATVFVTGESGTGKELCAQAVHDLSERAKAPFVAINCAAIPKELFESEIFGHVKGAFSGAVADRQGAAERANGGTLFLDEIGEMSLDLQVKLLRFIQTGTFQKVGSSRVQNADIRFVCATNRDPLEEVAAGRFREDLYYRLNVVPVHLPPLRDRDDDVLTIAEDFLRRYAEEDGRSLRGFDADVEQLFRRFDWPGNVRQLQNVIKNIVVLNDGDMVSRDMLPEPLRSLALGNVTAPAAMGSGRDSTAMDTTSSSTAPEGGRVEPLWLVERRAIETAVAHCRGNIPVAAALLGVSASTIYRKKKAWDSGEIPMTGLSPQLGVPA